MADVMTRVQRSAVMSRIRSRDTTPEKIIRSLLHSLGYRFRLHRRDLPGTPDLVFSSRRKVVFVHGCFWHSHAGCKLAARPKTRRRYWSEKLRANVLRDERAISALKAHGWRSLIIWECELGDVGLRERVCNFLDDGGRPL
jgi:DNA mismatch endonuclease (patch repair protein)